MRRHQLLASVVASLNLSQESSLALLRQSFCGAGTYAACTAVSALGSLSRAATEHFWRYSPPDTKPCAWQLLRLPLAVARCSGAVTGRTEALACDLTGHS